MTILADEAGPGQGDTTKVAQLGRGAVCHALGPATSDSAFGPLGGH